MTSEWIQVAITLGIAVLVVVRQLGERRVRVGGLFIIPLILAIVTYEVISFDKIATSIDIAMYVASLLIGGGIGWYQGTHMSVRVDRAASSMFVKASPIGAVIWAAVIVFRLVVRLMAGGSPTSSTGELVSAVLLVFALGVISGQRLYLRKAYNDAPA